MKEVAFAIVVALLALRPAGERGKAEERLLPAIQAISAALADASGLLKGCLQQARKEALSFVTSEWYGALSVMERVSAAVTESNFRPHGYAVCRQGGDDGTEGKAHQRYRRYCELKTLSAAGDA